MATMQIANVIDIHGTVKRSFRMEYSDPDVFCQEVDVAWHLMYDVSYTTAVNEIYHKTTTTSHYTFKLLLKSGIGAGSKGRGVAG